MVEHKITRVQKYQSPSESAGEDGPEAGLSLLGAAALAIIYGKLVVSLACVDDKV
jgi:hypothetical protein